MIIKPCGNESTGSPRRSRAGLCNGFTLIEVVIGAGLAGMLALTLYSAFGQSFAVVCVTRENLRATQILEEKTEVLRLIKWEDLITPGFVPTSQTEFYDPSGGPGKKGAAYTVITSIDNAPVNETYVANMRQVTITLTWTSNNVQRQRSMQTFVSRWGLQLYVYPLVKP